MEKKKSSAIYNPVNNPIRNPIYTAKRKAERDAENRRLIAADPARAAHLLTGAELVARAQNLWDVRRYVELGNITLKEAYGA